MKGDRKVLWLVLGLLATLAALRAAKRSEEAEELVWRPGDPDFPGP